VTLATPLAPFAPFAPFGYHPSGQGSKRVHRLPEVTNSPREFRAAIRRPTSVDVGARWSRCPLIIVGYRSLPLRLPSAFGGRWGTCGGSMVRYMRQVKSGVSHTGNRFGEPVAIACGHFLRAVLVVHTRVGVAHESNVDFTGHGRQAQCRPSCTFVTQEARVSLVPLCAQISYLGNFFKAAAMSSTVALLYSSAVVLAAWPVMTS
jgi:hypothetical protein